ncbi:nucleotidyl transferase AbiEii/AbiGii toxin family protein [Patescibacteria group bacterium]|nr:nucleotidyl transferase AbiEii/AbiGii toxin family protein [Patescibacteria group bacterium]
MLSKEQEIILETVFSSKIKDVAAWGGGTALSEIYLHHRRSEDVDIILIDLPPEIELTILTNEIKDKLKARAKKSVAKMNRFQYVFELDDGNEQKLEFVYYPFPKLAKVKKIDKIKVESLLDIAVAKTLSAYQRSEVKDVYDLFIILNEKKFTLKKLIDGVKKKFEEEIDPAMLLAKMTKNLDNYENLKPLLLKKDYLKKEIVDLFQSEFNNFFRNKKY